MVILVFVVFVSDKSTRSHDSDVVPQGYHHRKCVVVLYVFYERKKARRRRAKKKRDWYLLSKLSSTQVVGR